MSTFTNTYLFLKPQISTAEGRDNQRKDIETFVRRAIKQAGLLSLDEQTDGIEVTDISDELIQKVYEADVLIIDANCYEATGHFKLSPYLYYYMALGHALGRNHTILITNTVKDLPVNLVKYHTLTYSRDDVFQFIDRFAAVVEEIRLQKNTKAGNPIQNYLDRKALVETQRRLAQTEAEIEELRRQQWQGNQRPNKITFRPLN
jgi:hypothetical protein